MATYVSINGMGRIGRAIFRQALESDLVINYVNDPNMNGKQMLYLLTRDSTGQKVKPNVLTLEVDSYENEWFVRSDGTKIQVFHETDPSLIKPNSKSTIMFICTGQNLTREEIQKTYIDSGITVNVFLCSPSTDITITPIIYGINLEKLTNKDSIYSLSSCTTHAMAALLFPILQYYTPFSVFGKTFRSYTNDQNLLDSANRPLERGRAAAENIVPTTTEARYQLPLVFPTLKGKIGAQAFRAPVLLGGAIDLTLVFNKTITTEDIMPWFEQFAKDYPELISITTEPLVSSDVIGSTEAITFLRNKIFLLALSNGYTLVNLVGLYDNENGFAAQAIRTALYAGLNVMKYTAEELAINKPTAEVASEPVETTVEEPTEPTTTI